MPLCDEYALEMPGSFPAQEFASLMAEARRALLTQSGASAAWAEFAGASNLLGWRFRASIEAWTDYKASKKEPRFGGGHEELYHQERLLFLMFAAGVSSLESAVYAAAAACSHAKTLGLRFGPKEQQDCGPVALSRWLSPYPQATELHVVMSTVAASAEWHRWTKLRNRMAHRSNLPRRIYAWVGAAPPHAIKTLAFAATSSSPAVEEDFDAFDHLHDWLASALKETINATAALLRVA